MKKVALSISLLMLTAPAALAQFTGGPTTGGTGKTVPEITAVEGAAAVAAVLAVAALVWERRRRAA